MFLLVLASILLQIKFYTVQVSLKSLYPVVLVKSNLYYLTIRLVGGSIAHEAKPNGPVTLEDELSNCLSIILLVGQKRE